MTDKPDLTRRKILHGAPLAGAAALAAGTVDAEAVLPEKDDHRQVRIQDTDHVRTYYRLARG